VIVILIGWVCQEEEEGWAIGSPPIVGIHDRDESPDRIRYSRNPPRGLPLPSPTMFESYKDLPPPYYDYDYDYYDYYHHPPPPPRLLRERSFLAKYAITSETHVPQHPKTLVNPPHTNHTVDQKSGCDLWDLDHCGIQSYFDWETGIKNSSRSPKYNHHPSEPVLFPIVVPCYESHIHDTASPIPVWQGRVERHIAKIQMSNPSDWKNQEWWSLVGVVLPFGTWPSIDWQVWTRRWWNWHLPPLVRSLLFPPWTPGVGVVWEDDGGIHKHVPREIGRRMGGMEEDWKRWVFGNGISVLIRKPIWRMLIVWERDSYRNSWR